MPIKGFQGTSLLDFPGRIASLVFFGGCNLTCPFCHNPALVVDPEQLSDYPLAAVLGELAERRAFIDGVVLSGGEPTLAPELFELLSGVRALGLQVKLDTNGLAPAVLERLLAAELVDYVALDLKTAPERYRELDGRPVPVDNLLHSIRLLLEGRVDYELRTTCVPGFVEDADLQAIGCRVRGARRWLLQQFVPQYALSADLQALSPHSNETLHGFAHLAGEYVADVGVRGL